jgi:hypothetical protein
MSQQQVTTTTTTTITLPKLGTKLPQAFICCIFCLQYGLICVANLKQPHGGAVAPALLCHPPPRPRAAAAASLRLAAAEKMSHHYRKPAVFVL